MQPMGENFVYKGLYVSLDCVDSVLDLPLCLGVLKHRAPLVRGAHLPANFFWIFAYVVQF